MLMHTANGNRVMALFCVQCHRDQSWDADCGFSVQMLNLIFKM